MSLQVGSKAEAQALIYLKKHGLLLKEANFRCKFGEIDLIMNDDVYLVFVEVRMRSSGDYGGALESITIAKQRKIKDTAKIYLLQNKLYDKCPVRFDVLTIQGTSARIGWLKNAFI